MGWFTEECCVSSNGEPFEDAYNDVYDTIEDAITEWCSKMGIERGDRSESERLDYIHDYEYENEDTYFYINSFTFV